MQADHVPESSPGGRRKSRGKQSGYTDSDDTDFQESDGEEEAVSAEEEGAQDSIQELEVPQSQRRSRGLLGSQGSPISPVEHKGKFIGLLPVSPSNTIANMFQHFSNAL
jgi:hypothetical protein